MKYSLVATTYNDSEEILSFLHNIVLQSELPAEIVIADGGSTDNTVDLINEFAKTTEVPIKVLSGKRLNISEGYNVAIRETTYEYIGIAGVGNIYDEEYFFQLGQILVRDNVDVVYGKLSGYICNDFTRYYALAFLGGSEGSMPKTPTNHGCLIRKKIFSEIGMFYEELIYAGEDEEFYCRLLEKGYIAKTVSSVKVYWKTPESYPLLFKQINNYLIGSMQINKLNKCLNKHKVSLIVFFTLTIGIILPIFLLIPCILFLYYLIKYRNINASLVKIIYHFVRGLFFLKNIKYLKKEYKIKKEKINV